MDELVTVDPEIQGGTPVFRGTRVPVKTITDWLAGGYSLDEILDNFPSVTREQAVCFIEASGEALLKAYVPPAA